VGSRLTSGGGRGRSASGDYRNHPLGVYLLRHDPHHLRNPDGHVEVCIFLIIDEQRVLHRRRGMVWDENRRLHHCRYFGQQGPSHGLWILRLQRLSPCRVQRRQVGCGDHNLRAVVDKHADITPFAHRLGLYAAWRPLYVPV